MKPRIPSKPQNSTPRIEPLSVLPVFLYLNCKNAVVIGSESPAIWKAELLAKAGAKVTFICKAASAEVLQFVANVQSCSPIALVIAEWRTEDFSSAEIVVADVDGQEAAELFGVARKYTSLVNIIDKPAYCTFQFGSIVNKSPLVIGISTSGAAPVLAQHVRSLIEAVLPADIQSLANRAARVRGRVNEHLGASFERRKYWGAFFGKAFWLKSHREKTPGSAHVINATEVGDLTLRDLRALQSADSVYLVAGANPDIAKLARREAARFEVATRNPPLECSVNGGNSVIICIEGQRISAVKHVA